MAVHFEGLFIPYDGIRNKFVLEWPTKQKICTKMACAYQGPPFSVDGRVFMILKCRETCYVLETMNNHMFSKAVSESEDGADKE